LSADLLVIAAGRVPNSGNIGLENTAATLDRGFITVDAQMRTTQEHLYAVGDVIGGDREALDRISANGLSIRYAPEKLRRDMRVGVEALHLGGQARREDAGIAQRRFGHAGAALHEGIPGLRGRLPHRGDRAQARDDDTAAAMDRPIGGRRLRPAGRPCYNIHHP
jgi:hypothetical protein